MSEVQRQEILLESGTNEMEILEFYLGAQSFGINVQKLREIIPYDEEKTTTLPESAPSVVGTFLVRGNTIPLIDLNVHLNRVNEEEKDSEQRPIVLVCKFNNQVNGFLVDGVNQIHRICWENVTPMANFIEQYRPRFTGSINVNKREILIVDLEHIMAEIDPDMDMSYEQPVSPSEEAPPKGLSVQERREQTKIMLAEDSAIIRAGILKVLSSSGYSQIQAFVDGEECYKTIKELKAKADKSGEPITKHLNLMITDIEMPKMDGLTLCRRFREEMGIKDIPVIMFSSLINEQMKHKCDSVGANGCVSKPQIPELVKIIDEHLLKE